MKPSHHRHPWGSLKSTVAALDGCRVWVHSRRMYMALKRTARRMDMDLAVVRLDAVGNGQRRKKP